MAIWTAFTLGIVGSLHCVGMCGPIALALPYQAGSRWATAGNVLLYNTGRILMYALLGLLIGTIGKGLFLAGWQAQFSIAMGIALLVAVFLSVNIEYQLLRIPFMIRFNQWVKHRLGQLLGKRGPGTLFGIGMLNGLLPCGLVYMAVVGALSTGSTLAGSAYMAAFGLGTLPMLLGTALLGQLVNLKWRSYARKLAPLAVAVMAVLLIMRGVNFDIPHNFRFWEAGQEVPMCH